MLRKTSDIRGLSIQATDGEIGSVTDLLFDDESWTVRWLVVDTGSWLPGRKVLLPSSHLGRLPDGAGAIPVDLTRERVKASPDIDADRPVSRQMESSIYDYYGWGTYWPLGVGDVYLPPSGLAAGAVAPPPSTARPAAPGAARSGDPHLRSAREVTGYYVQATDEDIGHVEDFLVDAADWRIRYLIVDTRNWWPGKQVLVVPDWIAAIDWVSQTVNVSVTRQQVQDAPEYDPARAVDRAYEARFYGHYGRPVYWE